MKYIWQWSVSSSNEYSVSHPIVIALFQLQGCFFHSLKLLRDHRNDLCRADELSNRLASGQFIVNGLRPHSPRS